MRKEKDEEAGKSHAATLSGRETLIYLISQAYFYILLAYSKSISVRLMSKTQIFACEP